MATALDPKHAVPTRHRDLLAVWVPVALTWLVMTVELPLLTSSIGHVPRSTENLAIFGVAYGLVLFFEAPLFALLQAALVLGGSRAARARLRRLAMVWMAVVTAVMALAIAPPVFELWS